MAKINDILTQDDCLLHDELGLIVMAVLDDEKQGMADIKLWLRDIVDGDGTNNESKLAAIVFALLTKTEHITQGGTL